MSENPLNTLRDILIEQSNDELGHAEKIANRIIQLGGTPIMDPGRLLETSGCGYKQPPGNPADIKQVIQSVLDSEACAIETYNRLAEKYRMTDLVTHEMIEELLEDEVGDEEEWEKLAGIWK